ncbi:MAG: tetratricopeptide repeat protein [Gemmatimonadetes bacterium]|nr:tetratricopeptide repeat protein [Gemmatimonadota bacterium]
MVPILLGIGLFWSCSETGPEVRAQQHYQRGVEYEAQDMPASAAREYEEAAAAGMMEAYYALGTVYGKEEQHERAIGAYRALLRQWPEEERARKGLADQYLAVGRAAEAGALYEALLAEGRPWEGLWGRLGDARLVAGDAEGAEEAYRKMLEVVPDSARVRYSLAQLWAEQGQRREAIAEYRQLVQNPAWADEAGQRLADLLLEAGEVVEAEQLLRDLLERQPEARSALWSLGGLLFRAERYSESLVCFERLRALDQEDYRVYFLLAKLYGRTGREAEGLEALAAYERGRRTAQVHERMEEEIEGLLRNILK